MTTDGGPMQTTIKQLQDERAADRAQHQAERTADRARIAQLEDHILHNSGH